MGEAVKEMKAHCEPDHSEKLGWAGDSEGKDA